VPYPSDRRRAACAATCLVALLCASRQAHAYSWLDSIAALTSGLNMSADGSLTPSNENLTPISPSGTNAQVIPLYPETGAPAMTFQGSSPSSVTASGGAGSYSSPSTWSYQSAPDGADPMARLQNASYGTTAIGAAQQYGVTPNSLAAVAQAECGFRNIPTGLTNADGSPASAAAGVWQFTPSTWQSVSQQAGLGYTLADMWDPNKQAVEAAYLMQQNAQTVSQTLGRPVTVLDTYGAHVFGPTNGSRIASASDNTALSALVPASMLSANQMSGWTVGQFRQTMSQRLGPAANTAVLAGV